MDVADDRADLVRARPDVGEEDRASVVADAERLAGQVDVDASRERERDHERRRREVARPRERVDAPLEVAVAGQDGGDDELVVLDDLGDRRVERAGVADARRAAVAGEREAELLERPREPGRSR